jgi:PIN domain nuclease of toxin-antitoxin system
MLAAGVDGGAYLKALAAHAAVVPVTPEIAWLAASLSWAHHDPCDRHIVATALSLNVPLLSADAVISKAASALGLTVVW